MEQIVQDYGLLGVLFLSLQAVSEIVRRKVGKNGSDGKMDKLVSMTQEIRKTVNDLESRERDSSIRLVETSTAQVALLKQILEETKRGNNK